MQLELFTPPRLRPRTHVHIPPACLITRQFIQVFDGRLVHRFFDTSSAEGMRRFVAAEFELGEHVADRLIAR
jgi:hypothetical protein